MPQSLAHGFYDGVGGFFYKPYKGARDGGALGFAKGCGKGLTGIVYEPIYGENTPQIYRLNEKYAQPLTLICRCLWCLRIHRRRDLEKSWSRCSSQDDEKNPGGQRRRVGVCDAEVPGH